MAARQEVTVTNISMPFGSMVIFMVKWAIASIPAMILLTVIWGLLAGFVASLLATLGQVAS